MQSTRMPLSSRPSYRLDVLDLNWVAEARLDAERTDAAAIEALLQVEPNLLDLNRAVLSSMQSARTLRLNE